MTDTEHNDLVSSTKKLDRILEQIPDPQIRMQVAQAFIELNERRKFGLVFEEHANESVRLPNHKIRRGARVVERRSLDAAPRTVTRIAGTEVTLDDGTTVNVADLCVLSSLNEVFYPGFTLDEQIQRGEPTAPSHAVIKGENYHVLKALASSHKEKFDLIYIDPPYNTGSDSWIYNDRYVAGDDLGSSSKWLSFMKRRLTVAHTLLKDTGVIIAAIGDDEHGTLRLLMDQVFGRRNFISDVVWQGGRKNDSRYVSNGADYMLIYAKNEPALAAAGTRWREEKPGVNAVLEQGRKAWAEADGDEDEATRLMRAWFKSLPKDAPERAMSRNVYFLPDGTLARDDNITWPGGGGPSYDVIHPKTGKPVPVPTLGWRYSTPERMQEAIDSGMVIFREDHTKPISLKRPLESVTGQVVQSVFERQRTHSGRHLQDILGDKRFPFPKDHEVLARWIDLTAPKDALVLDFFGGSGSTLEAVLRLNEADGGTRQCVLVTNNEVGPKVAKKMLKDGLTPGDPEWEAKGVYEYVTRPRIKTIVTGVREDGSTYSDGLAANVAFMSLEYLDKGRVKAKAEYRAIAPLLWLWAGGVGPVISDVSTTGFEVTGQYGVLFDMDSRADFVACVNEWNPPVVFVVTDSPEAFSEVEKALPYTTTAHRLYSDYLENFEFTETE